MRDGDRAARLRCKAGRSRGTGRRGGLKIRCPQGRQGSNPCSGTSIRGDAIDLYRSKSAIVRGLEPVVERLARAGVSPDAATLAAVPIGVVAGACLLLSLAAPRARGPVRRNALIGLA